MRRAAGEILVTLDGDGQNDPADIPRLLAGSKDRDQVAGVRARRQDFWLRLAMSRLANSIRSRLLEHGLLDAGCPLKAFRSEVVEDSFPFGPFTHSWAQWQQLRNSASSRSKWFIDREGMANRNTGFPSFGGNR